MENNHKKISSAGHSIEMPHKNGLGRIQAPPIIILLFEQLRILIFLYFRELSAVYQLHLNDPSTLFIYRDETLGDYETNS